MLFATKGAPKKKKTLEHNTEDLDNKDKEILDPDAVALKAQLAALNKDNSDCSDDEQPNKEIWTTQIMLQLTSLPVTPCSECNC